MSLTRRKERELAFQMLFASQFFPEEDTDSLYQRLIEDCETEGAQESAYIKKVFCGAREKAPAILEKIRENAKGWKVERLSKTTLTILTLAIFEMEEMEEVPVTIAINEAVELSKRFDEEKSRKFVNGILGALAGE